MKWRFFFTFHILFENLAMSYMIQGRVFVWLRHWYQIKQIGMNIYITNKIVKLQHS